MKLDAEYPQIRRETTHREYEQCIKVLSHFLHHDQYRIEEQIQKARHQMALMVIEKALPRDGYALVVCPDAEEMATACAIIIDERRIQQRVMAVVDDAATVREASEQMTEEAHAPVLCAPADIAKALKTPPVKHKGIYGQDYDRITIVLCAEQWLNKITAAQNLGAPDLDLVVWLTANKNPTANIARQIKQVKRQKWLIISDEVDKQYLYDFTLIIFGKKTRWGD